MGTLDEQAVRDAVAGTSWEVRDGRLVLEVTRRDFAEAMVFVNAVAELAEQRNHHPDIAVHWNTVTLTQWSHSAGGVTDADVELAREIAALV
ncbi:MAG TPA: 4a-hydroxytetrahydrobiopterin dehydratase [Acidimicrobiales bacterium]|nr:4a-hydroxytetrahydrobiopterin dehydratase [Acidimicrobiales bacterium]